MCSLFGRFPILDLRPPDVRSIPPLWEKRLRDEVCLLRCEDVTFETSLQDSETEARYELRFKTLDGELAVSGFISGSKTSGVELLQNNESIFKV